ncbi:hypothetical protein [Marinobacter adhaerens]|uniref:hypothetical protein n=1 Tax=Marinobacter adhaerens TaxID=1033846 RepID=UPI001C55CB57|nr:hypothetical protein [Marinobacter adhaerens]MBW3227757.1 hypothetical protein [Marinobacter adhaerens]
MRRLPLSILLSFLVLGCTESFSKTKACYYPEGAIEQFENELNKQGYTYESSDDPHCVSVIGLSDEDHKRIRESLFGVSPPENLSVGWPITTYMIYDGKKYAKNNSKLYLKRLEDQGVKVRFMTYFGKRFLVWQEKDDATVRKILLLSN